MFFTREELWTIYFAICDWSKKCEKIYFDEEKDFALEEMEHAADIKSAIIQEIKRRIEIDKNNDHSSERL